MVGAACAYYLSLEGARVRILDAGKFGAGCSHGNCGFVCPSHVLPLATPGAIGKVIGAIVRGSGALSIRLRWDFALWRWLWNFGRRCRHDLMLQTAQANHALLQSSRKLYDQLRASPEFDCEWEDRGLLFVYNRREEFEAYAALEKLIREEFGVAGQPIDGGALESFEPALKPGLGGAWHYTGDAHLRPDKLMQSWRQLLDLHQVEIVEDSPVDQIVVEHDAVTHVETPHGSLRADNYVLATGALVPKLGRDLGLRLAVQPGKGYSLTMPLPPVPPTVPMILEEYHVAVTPFASGYRLGSTMEFAGYDTSINPRRIEVLRRGAEQCLKTPLATPVLETWYGWRPMTYDGLAYIGRAPGARNAYVAAGHGMLGVSTSPATGKLISELLNSRSPHIDPSPYSLNRA